MDTGHRFLATAIDSRFQEIMLFLFFHSIHIGDPSSTSRRPNGTLQLRVYAERKT